MKKLLALSIVGSSMLIGSNSAKADWDYWGFKNVTETFNGYTGTFIHLHTINSSTGDSTFRKRWCGNNTCYNTSGVPIIRSTNDILYDEKHIDKDTIILREYETNTSSSVLQKKYNLSGSTLSGETITDSTTYWYDDFTTRAIRGNAQIDSDGNYYSDIGGQMWIKQTTDGTISFGKSGSSTAIYSLDANGVSQGGTNLISRTSDGITSIGANSLKLQESGGLQKMWATDASGKSIPIDITNGSKLLISGRDVEQSINNVGALSAALTGLPTIPAETNLACGLGTGTHGGDFALSGGCASKVNEKLFINYAASMTMPGQDYAGDFEDTFSARAGFVWKLGEATKPTQISMNETKKLKKEISNLKENNQNIIAQNNALLARLERLEKVALGDLKSKDLAVYKLK
jgi:hypothetical protein